MQFVGWRTRKNGSKIKVKENKSKSLSLVGRGRPLQIVQLPQPTLYTVTIHLRHIKPKTKHISKHHQKVQGHSMGNLRQITIWSKNKRWSKFNRSTTNTVYSSHPMKPKHNMIEKRRKKSHYKTYDVTMVWPHTPKIQQRRIKSGEKVQTCHRGQETWAWDNSSSECRSLSGFSQKTSVPPDPTWN